MEKWSTKYFLKNLYFKKTKLIIKKMKSKIWGDHKSPPRGMAATATLMELSVPLPTTIFIYSFFIFIFLI